MPAEVGSRIADGKLIAGRYRILRALGGGGMADVFLAEDTALARLVAVKVLHGNLARNEQYVERFRREAQAAAALGHPNIVAIHDRGTADDLSFIVMEYVRGETLKERVRRCGGIRPDEAVEISLQLLAGLRFAHERHIVHRDVKAQNVLIDAAGTVKIADFGIARVGSSGLTDTGARMGTVQYVSPEQAKGEPADERSDLYSVGVILYEMLSGRLPFAAESDVALALKHASEPPPALASVVPGLPAGLDRITGRALAKDPDARYQTAAEFAADLRRLHGSAEPAGAGAGAHGGAAAGAGAAAGTRSVAGAGAGVGTGAVAGIAPVASSTAPTPRVAAATDRPLASHPQTAGPGRPSGAEPTRVTGAEPTQVLAERTIAADGAATRVVAAPGAAPSHAGGAAAVAPRAARRRRSLTLVVVAALAAALAAGGFVLYSTFFSPLEKVPGVVGQPRASAVDALKQDGFTVAVHKAYSDKYTDGYVVRQTPAAGSGLADGGKVHVWVRMGPVHVQLSDFTGKSPQEVETLLGRYGLTPQRKSGATREVEAGLVFRQRPRAGATVARGDTVAYWVSSGMPMAVVPDVIGASYGTAKADLEQAGFTVDMKTTIGFGEVPGTVIDQEPLGGAEAREGSVVTVWMALL